MSHVLSKQVREDLRRKRQSFRRLLAQARCIKRRSPDLWASWSHQDRLDACQRETSFSLGQTVAANTGMEYDVVPVASAAATHDIAKRRGDISKRRMGKRNWVDNRPIVTDSIGRIHGETTTTMYSGRVGYYTERTPLSRS